MNESHINLNLTSDQNRLDARRCYCMSRYVIRFLFSMLKMKVYVLTSPAVINASLMISLSVQSKPQVIVEQWDHEMSTFVDSSK